jgi:hypothetical protein
MVPKPAKINVDVARPSKPRMAAYELDLATMTNNIDCRERLPSSAELLASMSEVYDRIAEAMLISNLILHELGREPPQRPVRPFFPKSLYGVSPTDRAMELFKSNCSLEQRISYENVGYIVVKGCDTGRTYRIYHGRVNNIAVMNAKDEKTAIICVQPKGELPTGDVMLAQKLGLECFETDLLAKANVHDITNMTSNQRFWWEINNVVGRQRTWRFDNAMDLVIGD